jgi:hypothetical protein
MPKSLRADKMREYAVRGAEAALNQLKAEITAIEKAFPELGRGGRTVQRTVERGRQRARQMSAAARKAVSVRMKRYWAERRKAKANVK